MEWYRPLVCISAALTLAACTTTTERASGDAEGQAGRLTAEQMKPTLKFKGRDFSGKRTAYPDYFLNLRGWKEDCKSGVVTLAVVVSNAGQGHALEETFVEVNSLPTMQNLAFTPLGDLLVGQHSGVIPFEIDIADIGEEGLQIIVNADGAIEEFDIQTNEQIWDELSCPEDPTPSMGEIWGTASAHMGDTQGFADNIWPLADAGLRPGGVVWRLDLDTMQTEIVVEFDPADSDIWYLGGLALHPSEPIAYVTALKYDASGGYDNDDWLEGYDTLIALDTDTYEVIDTWDLEPDPFSFTGYAQDFVDGSDGLYSPGGIQFIDGELYAIEGMTVHNPDLVHFDMSGGQPELTEDVPAFAQDHWGGGVVTDNAGQHYAACSQTPEELVDQYGDELAYMPEPYQWIEFDMDGDNTCDDALFTFELDRVHGITLGGNDARYAVRSTLTYWYEEALGQDVGDADLNVYKVHDDGSMHPVVDLAQVMSTAVAPIDGLGNIDWRLP
jgi:hypothetical protein